MHGCVQDTNLQCIIRMGQHYNTIGYLGINNYYTRYQGQCILMDQPVAEPVAPSIVRVTISCLLV